MATTTVPRLYAIADAEALAPQAPVDAIAAWASAGVRWIQLRAKRMADAELWRQLRASLEAIEESRSELWINDRLDLALAARPFGLHLGQGDVTPSDARRLLGEDVRIGLSTHDRSEIEAAIADRAVDVIAVGPIFPTTGKRDPPPPVGLELLSWARERTEKPLVAIGGIDASNARSVLEAGASSLAVLGALCSHDPVVAARRLLAAVDG